MAYTKYSLTPANNNAAPPDGAPEGMLPSAVNDTMRDMMAQIRDVGDGIRGGTYTMTAPVITGGSITGVALSGNTFTNPVITGGSINNTPIGATTANTGAFTTLSASGAFSANGGATLGDASGDALTINSSAVSIPNGLNFDSNTFVIDATNNRVGINTSSPARPLDVNGSLRISDSSVVEWGGTSANIAGSSSSDTLFFRTASTERMRIDSSGNVGIGTSSPTTISNFKSVTVNATTGVLWDALVGGTIVNRLDCRSGEVALNSYGTLAFGTGSGGSSTERMRIDSSGNVGIGLTSSPLTSSTAEGVWLTPTDGAVIANNATVLSLNRNGTGGNDRINLELYNNGTLRGGIGTVGAADGIYFTTGSTERMRITSDGFMLIGQTADNFPGAGNTVVGGSISNTGRLSFSANGVTCGYFNRNSSDGQLIRLARQGNEVGGINVTTTATTYATSSDYRLKENIAPMQNALGVVSQLKPCTYTWKLDGSAGQGFIAHELQAVVPDCVAGEKDAVDEEGNPVYQGVDTSFLVATLTAAIQEQQAMIEDLKAEVALLKSK